MSRIIESIKNAVSNDSDKDKKEGQDKPSTAVTPIDQIASRSLIDVVKDGAFSGLTDDQRQSATFRTGTVLGASVFELSKAFDNKIDQKDAYRRGATGLISLFEVFFSAKRVVDNLQHHDRVINRDNEDKDPESEE